MCVRVARVRARCALANGRWGRAGRSFGRDNTRTQTINVPVSKGFDLTQVAPTRTHMHTHMRRRASAARDDAPRSRARSPCTRRSTCAKRRLRSARSTSVRNDKRARLFLSGVPTTRCARAATSRDETSPGDALEISVNVADVDGKPLSDGDVRPRPRRRFALRADVPTRRRAGDGVCRRQEDSRSGAARRAPRARFSRLRGVARVRRRRRERCFAAQTRSIRRKTAAAFSRRRLS